jgi:hypothetical protein
MAMGSQEMVMNPAMALSNILTETLPTDLSLLVHLPMAQVKSAIFKPAYHPQYLRGTYTANFVILNL